MPWFGKSTALDKQLHHVWYLGCKESAVLRGDQHVQPIVRQLYRESLRRSPNKIALATTPKGLKLVQTVPYVGKSGKLKTDFVKFHIPANSMTFCAVGAEPFTDIVALILLMVTPESRSPVQTHCYRCESAQAASVLCQNLRRWLGRPAAQKRIGELELRLAASGLLPAPSRVRDPRSPDEFIAAHHMDTHSLATPTEDLAYAGVSSDDNDDDATTISSSERRARLQRNLFDELKHRLHAADAEDAHERRAAHQHDVGLRRVRDERRQAVPLSRAKYYDELWRRPNSDGLRSSTTSGVESDVSSSRHCRQRYSLAAQPNFSLDDAADCAPPRRLHSPQLRLFGDTAQRCKVPAPQLAGRYLKARHRGRSAVSHSTDNLFEAGRYGASDNDDSFWKDRARRSSWYLAAPPNF